LNASNSKVPYGHIEPGDAMLSADELQPTSVDTSRNPTAAAAARVSYRQQYFTSSNGDVIIPHV